MILGPFALEMIYEVQYLTAHDLIINLNYNHSAMAESY